MNRTTDVLIVGAGPYGMSCAWWIASSAPGTRVTVVDQGDFACGGIGRNAAGMRMQWGLELNIRLCRESIGFFEEADKRLDYPGGIDLKQEGYLLLAHEDGVHDELRSNHALQQKLGVPSVMMTPEDCTRLVPALSGRDLVGGAFCEKDGSASPFLWMDALFQAARRAGVEIVMGCRIEKLVQQGGSFLAVARGADDFSAAKVLVCTDWAAPELLRTVGVDLPITAMPKQGLVTEAWPTVLSPFVISFRHELAINQVRRGNIVAVAAQERPDGDGLGCTPDYLSHASGRILDCLPGLADINVIRTWGGVISKTPDMQAVLGETEVSDLYVAVSAYKGFMTSPAVGRIISEAVLGESDSPDIRPFGADRFRTGELIPEPTTV